MNFLAITGRIHFKPSHERLEGKKVLQLTILSIDKRFEPQMAAMLNCQWHDPPDAYWEPGRINVGDMIYAEGPIHQAPLRKGKNLLNKTLYLEILFFSIVNTQEDFEAMKRRAIEKAEKSRKK